MLLRFLESLVKSVVLIAFIPCIAELNCDTLPASELILPVSTPANAPDNAPNLLINVLIDCTADCDDDFNSICKESRLSAIFQPQ